jgi:hypothetical protein
VSELNVADLVVALFIVYGVVVITLVFGFIRAVMSRQRPTRVASRN